MMEQVYISGRLGKAIFKESGKRYVVGVEHPKRPAECRPPDLSMFFGYGAEFISLPDASLGLDGIGDALEFQTKAHRALSLFLSGLDEELDNDTRSLAIDASQELLRDAPVYNFVRSRVLARPVPGGVDLESAQLLAGYTNSGLVKSLYGEMLDAADAIPALLESWGEAALEHFDSRDEQAEGERLLIEAGVFADISIAIAHGNLKNLNTLIVKHGLNPKLKEKLPQAPRILNALRSNLTEKSNLRDGKDAEGEGMFDARSQVKPRASKTAPELLTTLRKGKEKRKPRTLSTPEVKEKVDHQIEAIEGLIQRGNLSRAETYLQDLIRFQVTHSEREHLAMSLCSLTKTAMDAHALGLAEIMLGYAFDLGLNDVVIWTTKAEMLKAMSRLPEALAAYDDAVGRFPGDAVARNGRAEVLKEMGRLDEALEAYEQTIKLFQDNAVARSGRAEVLKEMGRLDEALEAYEQTIKLFQDNAVARNGRASILMLVGRINEARALLTREHLVSRDDWIGYHIVAMSYLKTGEIDEAIRRLTYGLENSPWERQKKYFVTALGVARIKRQQFAEAVEVLETNIVRLDVFQRQKRLALIGHSQAALGNHDEAVAALASLEQTTNTHLHTLREDLVLRFNLDPKSNKVVSTTEIAALDERIDEKEFYLAMAA